MKSMRTYFCSGKLKLWYFYSLMFIAVLISAVKVHIWYIVIELFSKLNLKTPFSIEVVRKLEKISYALIGIWVLSLLARAGVGLFLNKNGAGYW